MCLTGAAIFSIGEFSRLTRVTVKMLRHYDKIGLLIPSFVNAASGYRYYRAEQLPRLNRMIALKDLGFSLEDIAKLLDAGTIDTDAAALLTRRRIVLEQSLAQDSAGPRLAHRRIGRLQQNGLRNLPWRVRANARRPASAVGVDEPIPSACRGTPASLARLAARSSSTDS